jgi:NADPH-dependent 2,4-dienoyl-CoA reductase/sulfur reductase-like enzyme
MVFLTAGVSPNLEIAKAAGIACDRGILVDPMFRTTVPHVWAGGDCAQHRSVPPGRRPVEQVWYTGRMHGEHIAANLCGVNQPYQPGLWFNSAKFFDIEYQTYGVVLPRPGEEVESFYWEHPDGDKCLHLHFQKSDRKIVGVNVFGIRHRHAVWEHWMLEGVPVEEALANLGAANFDPEFYRQYEQEIVFAFSARFPGFPVRLKTRKGLFSSFMRSLSQPRRVSSTAV